ncbi:hypothetical protein QBC40DRAFT_312940 [Triangularia verruculosa]|uniref:C2H2-type domain-containing protein n=1 Tax=Triangularia verruculosa TaxID=2587418 RepID=A0AAN7AT73_9PEZI|nr:hypothetical protein QBC40DRAFT_312940 [Triangularia verruculosa]
MQTPSLLGLPLEVRELIYRVLISDDSNQVRLVPDQKCDRAYGCNSCFTLGLCCHQLHDEFCAFAGRHTIRISTRHDSKNLYASVPCLCGFRTFRPCIRIDINPFQDRGTIPGLYKALLSLSRSLGTAPGLPRVEIRLEGILPRRTPPLWLNELDLERAPVHMIVLLAPFAILHGVKSGRVSIVGGPLNDPWENHCFLTAFAARVCRSMRRRQGSDSRLVELAASLGIALDEKIIMNEQRLSHLVGLGLYRRRVLGSPPNDSVLAGLKYMCSVCGNRFQSQSQIMSHADIFHKGEWAMDVSEAF